MTSELAIFATLTGVPLAKKICDSIKKQFSEDISLGKSTFKKFADGTILPVIEESVRKKDCYIVCCLDDSVFKDLNKEDLKEPDKKFLYTRTYNDNFMELIGYISALYSSEAKGVNVIVPTFPFGRQERTRGREPRLAKMAADFMESAGAQRVISIDVHSEVVQGFFNKTKFQNLYASTTIIEYLKIAHPQIFTGKDFAVIAPDFGGIERARYYANKFNVELIKSDKKKNYEGTQVVEEIEITANPPENSYTVDDMVDTAGTIVRLAEKVEKRGGRNLYMATTHPLFNNPAIERLTQLYEKGILRKLYGTNTVNHFRDPEIFKTEGSALDRLAYYGNIPIEDLIGQCVYRIHNDMSVSQLLK